MPDQPDEQRNGDLSESADPAYPADESTPGSVCGVTSAEGGLTYAAAGVDIAAGEEAVRRIIPLVEDTRIPGVMGSLGGFAALYEMPKMEQPVLVTATDGVGTKLLVAQEAGKLNTIGIDLVAMCVNDVLTVGASPVLFLDYLAVEKLVPDEVEQIVAGIARGCKQAGCALVGGEMAEMPGLYRPGEFDVAGFCVAIAEKANLIDGSAIEAGDIIIGLASSGLHSNGYSLVRRVLEANQCDMDDKFPHFGETVAHTLLLPTRIYVDAVWSLLEKGVAIRGMAHVTGGGLAGNLSRVLPEGLGASIHFENWKIPKVFRTIQLLGDIEDAEMFRTFNMGVGFVVIVPFASAEYAARLLLRAGEEPMYLGAVVTGDNGVRLQGVS